MNKRKLYALFVLPFLMMGCSTKTPDSGDNTNPSKPGDNTGGETGGDDSGGDNNPSVKDDTYVIEAEYTNLEDLVGHGYSGGALGKDMVQKDRTGAGASNGYWVGYLYGKGLHLDFIFTSDKAVSDVTLTLRLTSEVKDVTLTSDMFSINVNDTEIKDYGTIQLLGASSSDSSEYVRPFTDFKCRKTIDIKEGENKIVFTVTNDITMGGTMFATAPMFDCIKLKNLNGATLNYDPITDNLSEFTDE